jgi:hypothetical protein
MQPTTKKKLQVAAVALCAALAIGWMVRVAIREFSPPTPRVDFDDPSVRSRLGATPKLRPYVNEPVPQWNPTNAWWRRATIDAYDAMKYPTQWPGARRAVVQWAKMHSDDVAVTGDEDEEAGYCAGVATEAGCADPLVRFIGGRILFSPTESLAFAEQALKSRYPAATRCRMVLGAARAAAGGDPEERRRARGYLQAALELVPEVMSDPALPQPELLGLAETAGDISEVVDGDRSLAVGQILAAAEQAKLPAAARLTLKGSTHIKAGWDARGGGWARDVTPQGWQGLRQQLQAARAALEVAWRTEPDGRWAAWAALAMLRVELADSRGRDEMEAWYRRALKTEPDGLRACRAKLLWLHPSWHGSPEELIAFGRELIAQHAGGKPPGRLPAVAVQVHWNLAHTWSGRNELSLSRAYFAQAPPDEIWRDVQAVYGPDMSRMPGSRYHLTRYAILAAHCGRWAEADRVFKQLGGNTSGVSPMELGRLPQEAAVRAAGGSGATGDRPPSGP